MAAETGGHPLKSETGTIRHLDAAVGLARHADGLNLGGLRRLSSPAAAALPLRGLRDVSDAAIAQPRDNPGIELPRRLVADAA